VKTLKDSKKMLVKTNKKSKASDDGLCLQYGCGWHAPNNWRNFDGSPTLRAERLPILGRFLNRNIQRFPLNVEYGDIVKGLPVSQGSCSAIYCSHILEHLSLSGFRIAIKNTYNMLCVGGVFRLVVPDLEVMIDQYAASSERNAATRFISNTGLGRKDKANGLNDFIVDFFGNSNHLWMWDYKSLELELTSAGFSSIRRADFNDAINHNFLDVEVADRWTGSLGVECIRSSES
jgi:hypothetical protein